MALRELRIYPDPVLRKTCQHVERFDKELAGLLDDMAESMYVYRGVGLAAPQIGVLLRAMVVDVEQGEGTSRLIELVNPEILEVSDEGIEYEEGCLSFPGEVELVTRPATAKVRAYNRQGQEFEIDADGLLAVALQHEVDHLNGKLFVDHISRLRRSLIDRRMRKRAKVVAC